MPRASRRRGDAARRHADTIRFVLFEARPAGLEFAQLVRASGLSPSQVRSGLAALRDLAAEWGYPPLIWTKAGSYQLGADRAALEAYERPPPTTPQESKDRVGRAPETPSASGYRASGRTVSRRSEPALSLFPASRRPLPCATPPKPPLAAGRPGRRRGTLRSGCGPSGPQ